MRIFTMSKIKIGGNMALKYDYTAVAGYENYDKELHDHTAKFAWQMMAIDMQEITEQNWKEVVFRLKFLSKIGYGSLMDNSRDTNNISIGALKGYIKTLIGYQTNVGQKTRSQFMRRWMKAVERNIQEEING